MTFRRSSVDTSKAATAPEATSEPKGAAKRFCIRAIVGASIVFAALLSIAIALGIQDHNDRVLGVQVA